MSIDEIRRALSGPREGIKTTRGRSIERLRGYALKSSSRLEAARSWKNAHALAVRGIPTPRLLAGGDGWVLSEWVEGEPLWEHFRARAAGWSRAERVDFVERLARLVRRMHQLGVFHKDLKANNILAGKGGFAIVDLGRIRFGRALSDAERRFNFAQLNAAVGTPVTRADRLRFLRCYAVRDPGIWRARRRWVSEIMRRTLARRHHWPPR